MKKYLIIAAALLAGISSANAATVLITGSNRGLGLEFVKQYAARGDTIIATTRNPADAKDLNELAAKNKKITVEKLDVLDQAAVNALQAKYKDKPIDILINSAGVLGAGHFGNLTLEEFNRVLDTNTFGTLAMVQAFQPNLAASQMKKVVGITSPAGSFDLSNIMKDGKMIGAPESGKEAKVARNVQVSEGGGFYYSMSKVALNMAAQKIRPQLKKQGIAFVLIAPNAVDTDMLSELGFKGPAMTAPDAISRFLKIIDSTTPDNQGRPVVQDGTLLNW
jgi:NAD(P)-dependent dehydrogenase (short-subunit alcohol dehydrogenase family)